MVPPEHSLERRKKIIKASGIKACPPIDYNYLSLYVDRTGNECFIFLISAIIIRVGLSLMFQVQISTFLIKLKRCINTPYVLITVIQL